MFNTIVNHHQDGSLEKLIRQKELEEIEYVKVLIVELFNDIDKRQLVITKNLSTEKSLQMLMSCVEKNKINILEFKQHLTFNVLDYLIELLWRKVFSVTQVKFNNMHNRSVFERTVKVNSIIERNKKLKLIKRLFLWMNKYVEKPLKYKHILPKSLLLNILFPLLELSCSQKENKNNHHHHRHVLFHQHHYLNYTNSCFINKMNNNKMNNKKKNNNKNNNNKNNNATTTINNDTNNNNNINNTINNEMNGTLTKKRDNDNVAVVFVSQLNNIFIKNKRFKN